jgi:anhydro-N-acetylmuramic acid kinase
MEQVTAIGMMSGTSLDGVDIALCRFQISTNKTSGEIIAAETIPYAAAWRKKLEFAHLLPGRELTLLDYEYGTYLGQLVADFADRQDTVPQFIASHGHTVFHQPAMGFTLQIGHGAAIAAHSEYTVVSDFRSLDVALGGQGAPLVPVGDKHLFGDFEFCLNLGGFANISLDSLGQRIAFDICPANIALNYFAGKLGLNYDAYGKIASSGKPVEALANKLNGLEYYSTPHPKSLGREWFETAFLPLIDDAVQVPDVLHTLTHHIAGQIGKAVSDYPPGKILTTGGGAENSFLISRIQACTDHEIVVPEKKLVHFKEALVFAYLGFLRLDNKVNTLASVTGACYDSPGGSVFRF